MTCSSCSCDLAAGAQFCVRCGAPQAAAHAQTAQGWGPVAAAGAYPAYPAAFGGIPQSRVMQNLQALGMAWCAFGLLRFFAAMFALHAARVFGWGVHMHHLWPAVGFSTTLFSGLCCTAGLGLLAHKCWARKLSMFLGVLALFSFPVGTALGVYTLWVLGPRAARSEWQRLQPGASFAR